MENKSVLKHTIGVLAFMLLFIAAIFLVANSSFAEDGEEPIDISTGKIILSQNTYTYDGQAKYPEVTVIVNGEELNYYEYDYSYSGNTKAGTAKVTVTADEYYGYTGKLTKNFTIKKRALGKSRFSLSKNDFVYNGKVKKLHGTYTYTDGRSKYMKVGRDIRITPSKIKKVGKYKITVRGIGNFKGALKYTVTVRPKNPKGVTLAKRGKKTFRVKWKKVPGATGYSVEYWSDKKGKYISKNRKKKRFFDVPVNPDFTGTVVVYSYKKVNGKKIKSTGKYYYNGVKPTVKPRFGLRTEGRSFIVKMKRDGYYEMWTATNKKFTKDFKPFTFYRSKNEEFTIYGASSGEFYRYIKIRHYVPTKGKTLYGPWSKIRRAYWY